MAQKVVQEVDKSEQNLEIFRLKRLIKKFENSKGEGTALLTLIIPANKQLTDIQQLLKNEYSAAANIQDKTMKESVQDANIKMQNRLENKYGNRAPKNGLVLLAGRNIEEQIIDFVPWKRMDHFIFKSDDRLHLDKLRDLANFDEPMYGFIVIDGHSALFATIQGNTKTILNELQVNLPNKHNKGGQSSVRFARHYQAARVDWVKKVSEKAKETFLKDNLPLIKGLVLAGSADFKRELSESQFLEKNLKEIVIALVDVSYGGQAGLIEAQGRCKETLQDMQLNLERKLLSDIFDHLAKEDDLVVYGKDETIEMLEKDALETIIIHDSSTLVRIQFKNKETHQETTVIVKPDDYKKTVEKFAGYEVVSKQELVDWLAENATAKKIRLEFVSDRSPEGNQFVKGFQGIAGISRFKIQKDFITGAQNQEFKDDDDEDFL